MTRKKYKREKQNGERKRDHLIFLICLLLATGFWFLIKLSDNYSVSYQLKIKYTHVPAGKLITRIEDSSVTIHFQSNGYNLLDIMLHRKLDSLAINLSKCDIRRQDGNEYAIRTSGLRENLAQDLAISDRDLEFAKPELRFIMERLHKKKIKIAASLDLKFKSQFNLYGYKITPATITVYGSQQILDTLKVLHTVAVHMENLDRNQKVLVNIQNPYPGLLKLYPSKVHISLNVERYTEQRIKIPVDVSAIHPQIRTFPATVSVSFNVFLRDYEKIHASRFKIIPNIKNIDLRKVKTLRLEMVSAPKEISNIRIVPPEVEFIIVN